MKILAFDASTEAASAALYDDEEPTAGREIFRISPRAHARLLLPAAQTLLDSAGLTLKEIDGIAFARGPGAFTGLRIAAGLVQGLAAGVSRPVAGVSTLAALAARALELAVDSTVVQVVQDARMGEVYTASFKRLTMPEPDGSECVLAPADLAVLNGESVVRAGNGWPLVMEEQSPDDRAVVVEFPHALDVARLAAPVFRSGGGGPAASALPVYIRDNVAHKPGQAG